MSAIRPDRCAQCVPAQGVEGLCSVCLRRHFETLRRTVSDYGGCMAALDARLTLLEDAMFQVHEQLERRKKNLESTT